MIQSLATNVMNKSLGDIIDDLVLFWQNELGSAKSGLTMILANIELYKQNWKNLK